MQYDLPNEDEGCFVFEVVNSPISARSQPNILTEDKTRLEFEVGELVSIDLIQHSSTDKNNGPYLRLMDRSGWLFGICMGQERMRRLPVERGLWPLYVDNFPNGQYLRRHPVVSPDLDFEVDGEHVLYEPGTKIYCDAKVVHPNDGVTFYRVQGTRGWVFDHKPPTSEGGASLSMLLCDNQVRSGLFCYQAVQDIVIRLKPGTGEDSMTREMIKAGEIVAVDYIRENTNDTKDGPFLRLADGMGWLFAKKQGITMMKNLPVSEGSWVLRCLNHPVGVGLRRHPIVCQDKLYPVVYPTGSMVQCDHKVSAVDGTSFYHVTGTRGWLFDRRGSTFVVELLSFDEKVRVSMHSPWEPNFVRGVAATVEDISEKEEPIDDQKGLLTFERPSGADVVVVHVYCKSRTVVVCLNEDYLICEQNCSTNQLVGFLKYDAKALTEMTLKISLDETMPTGNITGHQAIDETIPKETQNLLTEDLEISDSAETQSHGGVGVEIVRSGDNPICNHELAEDKKVDDKQNVANDTEDQKEAPVQDQKEAPAHDMLVTDPAEICLRRELLALESAERETREKRVHILSQLKLYDDERGSDATLAKELTNDRLREMKMKEHEEISCQEEKIVNTEISPDGSVGLILADIPEDAASANVSYLGRLEVHSPVETISPRSQTSVKSHRSSRSGRSTKRREFQCGECGAVFATPEDREDHCRLDHGIVCEVCDKAFKSFRVLDLHKDRNDHW